MASGDELGTMRYRVWFILAATLLAGCNGIFVGDQTPTVTPAPVPAAEPTTEQPEQLAPGVAETGSLDLATLTAAHADAIRGRSYGWVERLRLRHPTTEPARVRTIERRVRVENETRYAQETSRLLRRGGEPVGTARNHTQFVDGDTAYTRVEREGSTETEYHVEPAEETSDQFVADATDTLERYLNVESATVDVVRRDGIRRYRVRGRGLTTDRIYPIRNYTVVAYVDKWGFVSELTATFVTAPGGSVTETSYHFEYRGLDRTTVSRPSWIETARERANRSTPNGTSAAD